MTQTVIGLFPRMDTMLTSARRVRIYDIEEITLLSPVPLEEEAEDLLPEKKKDPVRFYTFFGSLTGLFAGALFAVGVSILYPLPRGGRPIAVIPPTLIISFETLILFGVLATFGGFLLLSGLITLLLLECMEMTGKSLGTLVREMEAQHGSRRYGRLDLRLPSLEASSIT